MKKAERRKLKEAGVKPQHLLKAIRKYKEGSFTYNDHEVRIQQICPECGKAIKSDEGTTCDVCDRGLMCDDHFTNAACMQDAFPDWDNICDPCWKKYLEKHPEATDRIPNYELG